MSEQREQSEKHPLFLHTLPKKIGMLHGRHPFIVEYCKGKNVLHIGCVDSGIQQQRFDAGELLHQKLDAVCASLWGIDIDKEGLAFLKNNGFENVLYANIQEKAELAPLGDQRFDIIVLSEVIEHLPNMGMALDALETIATQDTEFLISVPNAFSYSVLASVLQHTEFVHPDHNYYFSYTTLNTLLSKFQSLPFSTLTLLGRGPILYLQGQ